MAVSTFQQTDSATQPLTDWAADLDGNVAVLTRLGDMFAPHQQATPNMTAALDPGHVFDGTTLTDLAAQSTAAITAPVSFPRIDRVVVDQFTGIVSVVTGTEAASPVPPAIPAGTMPVAQILLQTSSTAITNAMITDERDFSFLGGGITGVTAGTGLTGGGTAGTVTIGLATPVSVADGGTGATAAGPTAANNIGALAEANNLSDLTNVSTAQTNLGLGNMATQNANAVAITGGTITGLPNPTNASDAATKAYVDATAQGLSVRDSVAAASTGAMPNSPTYNNGSSGVGATLTASSNGALTVDGYAVNTSDRLLVKDQAAGQQNGIYTVTNTGSGLAPYVLTRSGDADSSANLVSGIFTFVEQGTTNTGAGFVLTTPNPITVGTTVLTFTQFSGAGEITVGTGLSKSGNTLSLNPAGIGSIGGVEAFAPVAHQWINSISTVGVPNSTQPAFTDISGQAALTQLPSIGNDTILGNNSGASTVPAALTASNVLDMVGATQGDILYRGSGGWSALAPGTSGQVLQSQGAGANPQWANGNPGTVTSIGLSMPADFTVSGSPVTSSGTFTVTYAHESANVVLAGPSSGSPASPTWRGLVWADLPAGVAPLNNPAFTGTPTVPTPAPGDNSTTIADTAFVQAAINNFGIFKYINTAATVTPGIYLVDTSAGGFTVALSSSAPVGAAWQFNDITGTWAANNLTINVGSYTITPPGSTVAQAGPLTCNVGGEFFSLWFNGSTLKVF